MIIEPSINVLGVGILRLATLGFNQDIRSVDQEGVNVV